jgi:hypothetical protein
MQGCLGAAQGHGKVTIERDRAPSSPQPIIAGAHQSRDQAGAVV